MARVTIFSVDSDPQFATVRLVHDANVVIVEDREYIPENAPFCGYLQAGFDAKRTETITLECNTYKEPPERPH